jgi:hypothetical protein
MFEKKEKNFFVGIKKFLLVGTGLACPDLIPRKVLKGPITNDIS